MGLRLAVRAAGHPFLDKYLGIATLGAVATKEWYTITEAARRTGVVRQRIYQLVQGPWREACQIIGNPDRPSAWLIPARLVEDYSPDTHRQYTGGLHGQPHKQARSRKNPRPA